MIRFSCCVLSPIKPLSLLRMVGSFIKHASKTRNARNLYLSNISTLCLNGVSPDLYCSFVHCHCRVSFHSAIRAIHSRPTSREIGSDCCPRPSAISSNNINQSSAVQHREPLLVRPSSAQLSCSCFDDQSCPDLLINDVLGKQTGPALTGTTNRNA